LQETRFGVLEFLIDRCPEKRLCLSSFDFAYRDGLGGYLRNDDVLRPTSQLQELV
jgi:hypothetical protein